MSNFESVLAGIAPEIVAEQESYVSEIAATLGSIGVLDGLERATAEGHSTVSHGLGVARVARYLSLAAGADSRQAIDSLVGGVIHDAGKTLPGYQYSRHDSIQLETELRGAGLHTIAQAVRHNPYLVTADVRHGRLSLAQWSIAYADAMVDGAGNNVGLRQRLEHVIGRKTINGEFQTRYTGALSYYANSVRQNPIENEFTFIERFDGRYPISSDAETQGKLSSLHIARGLARLGVHSTIMAYVNGRKRFTVDGVLIDGDNSQEHLDEMIDESNIVFVTGWTSAFERLYRRAVPASIVMRSILESSLSNERLERLAQAGEACILVSSESSQKIAVTPNAQVIPNGYDEDVFSFEPRQIEKKIFFAGALVPEKGIDYLISVAKQLPDFEFVVAGSSNMYGERGLVWSFPENIRVLGEVSQEQLAEQFRTSIASLALTDPTRIFEVFGKSAVESIICGCPLIYIKNGGLNSNIVKHRLTVPIDNADVNQIVNTIQDIEKVAKNLELREDLSSQARNMHITWSEVSKRFFARGLDSVMEAETIKQSR